MTEPSAPVHGAPYPSSTAVAASTAPAVIFGRLTDQQAARILIVAAGAGALAQLLFMGQQSGINVGIWVACAMLAALATRPPAARLDRQDLWLPVAALAFAGFIGFRDDDALRFFNLLAGGWLTLLAVAALGGFAVTRSSAAVLSALALGVVASGTLGAALLAHGVRPIARPMVRRSPRAAALLRGLLIGVPMLLVFVFLFSAADGVFGAQLAAFMRWHPLDADAATRLLFGLGAAWLFAGTMVCAWLARPAGPTSIPAASEASRPTGHLGHVEAAVVLVLLNAAFALFVAIQAAYLFGGLDTLAVSGLTYADYARRGFFELIAVTTLVGLILMAFGRVVAAPGRWLKGGAILLALLTGLVLISATYRLALYQGAYGWTELRFYVLATIIWLAMCLVAAIVTTATEKHRLLPTAVVLSGLLVAGAVNLVGPQAFVVERNLERAINPELVASGGRTGLDTGYLASLGADAVPALVAARDQLPAPAAGHVERILNRSARELRAQDAQTGWPSWSLARHRALEALAGAGY